MFKITNALGLDDSHVVEVDFGETVAGIKLHTHLVAPFTQLRLAAKQAGFNLGVASGYRSFDRQLLIWNAKVNGVRPVLNASELPLDVTQLAADQLLEAILHWSALPGGSRHHWGTDFDIFDADALTAGQSLALTLCETQTVFAPFYGWLAEYLACQSTFVRPYMGLGAVALEPWHLSYKPLALRYQALLSADNLWAALRGCNLGLMPQVLARWPRLYHEYIEAYFVS